MRLVVGVTLAMLLCPACVTTTEGGSNDGWISLFNGKNLDGWVVKCKPEDAGKDYWSVEDGAILCDTRGDRDHEYVWLMTESTHDDFELALEVQSYADCPGNSGVQIRSRYDDAAKWLDGPQIDIHPPAPFRIGYVYDETRGTRRWIYPSQPNSALSREQVPVVAPWEHSGAGDGWNTLRIRCEGTRIQTFVNGAAIADYDGAGLLDDAAHQQYGVGLNGHVALQLHIRDDVRIRFRNLRLKSL